MTGGKTRSDIERLKTGARYRKITNSREEKKRKNKVLSTGEVFAS
jgi:hypothetical protein